jgi:hypothetical protein
VTLVPENDKNKDKQFIKATSGVDVALFSLLKNKLECFNLASFSSLVLQTL